VLKVTNANRKTTVMQSGKVADTMWTRLKGLIGVQHLIHGSGLMISPCNSIHCMFMSIPIDVLYVDKENKVVGLTANMKPWRLGKMYWKAKYVLELPVGTIVRSRTEIGDQLDLRER
jgi:uncharacterized protein